VSRCKPEPHPFDFRFDALDFATMEPLSMAAVTFRFAARSAVIAHQHAKVRRGSCVTSITGQHGDAQLSER